MFPIAHEAMLTIVTSHRAPRRSAGTPMSSYRAYIVGPDGHFKSSEIVSAPDDAAAVEKAATFVTMEDGVEVWLLDRKVRKLDPKK